MLLLLVDMLNVDRAINVQDSNKLERFSKLVPGVMTPDDEAEVLMHRSAEDAVPIRPDEQVTLVAVECHRLHRTLVSTK